MPCPCSSPKILLPFISLTYVLSWGRHVLPGLLLTKFVTVHSRRQAETEKDENSPDITRSTDACISWEKSFRFMYITLA